MRTSIVAPIVALILAPIGRAATLAVISLLSLRLFAQTAPVVEFPIHYDDSPSVTTGACHPAPGGSTHEITYRAGGGTSLYITGQNYDRVVQVTTAGAMKFFDMPSKSGPHGIEFDASGRLWVTLEFSGLIVRLNDDGQIVQTIDVNLACASCPKGKLNTHPHGLGFGKDGQTIWFTGKATGTIGRIDPTGRLTTYPLAVGSVPIYVHVANDAAGTIWATELVGNAIVRINPATGEVLEIPIPTHNSRPIAIVREPGSDNMWFTEEAGNRIGRVTPAGTITEFPLPLSQSNVILAGLAFDSDKNLWVQQYIDQNNPTPANPSPTGGDYIVKIDKSILTATDMTSVPMTYYKVPSTQTIMHRIIQGPDGNMWFTELGINKVGKLTR